MKKILVVSFSLRLIGCTGINRQTKKVDCVGLINIQTTNKTESVKLIKYDPINKQFYSAGKPFLGMMGWFNVNRFDNVICTKF
ncbi:hypothetical protein [Arsenophonus nasoniae]|uniref:hypothetical protein n=1 Tax=Arsenophonus nasoniae TaxID=638 RepID=UPI003879AFF8